MRSSSNSTVRRYNVYGPIAANVVKRSAEGWRERPALALFLFSIGTRSTRRSCLATVGRPQAPPSVAPVKAPRKRGFCFLGQGQFDIARPALRLPRSPQVTFYTIATTGTVPGRTQFKCLWANALMPVDGGRMIARLGASRVKDQEVRTVYLDMAARWRRTAQQEAIDDVLGDLRPPKWNQTRCPCRR